MTFDYGVPEDESDPEVLAVNIIEMEVDSGEFANGVEFARQYLCVQVNPTEYLGKKILAVPRCCQKKPGTTHRHGTNWLVEERKRWATEEAAELLGRSAIE